MYIPTIWLMIMIFLEGPVPLYKEPTFDITNNTNARNTYTLQNGEGKPRQEIKPAVSNPTLLQTGAHELDTPFISRAASYNSAVGYNSAEGERTNSKQRIPNTGHEVNLNAHTVHSNHNSNENYRKTLNGRKWYKIHKYFFVKFLYDSILGVGVSNNLIICNLQLLKEGPTGKYKII